MENFRFTASFTKGGAAIGFDNCDQLQCLIVATAFRNPKDSFCREKAKMILMNRLDYAKSGSIRLNDKFSPSKNIIMLDVTPLEQLDKDSATHVLLDCFNEAVNEGNVLYDTARRKRAFPLPSRADTIREIFVKKVAEIDVREHQTA